MIKKITEKYLASARLRQTVKYVAIGLSSSLVNYGAYILLHYLAGFGVNPANIIAVLLAVLYAYIANKLFVFHSHCTEIRLLCREATAFFASRLITLLIEVFGVMLITPMVSIPAIWVKLVMSTVIFFINYAATKGIIFRVGDR